MSHSEHFFLGALVLTLCLGGGSAIGCAEVPLPMPEAPAPTNAPDALTAVSFYVHQIIQPFENDDDKYDYSHMPGYTNELRSAFSVALARAGYKVSVSRSTKADLIAIVHEEWQFGSGGDDVPRPDGVATLALRDGTGAIVDRFSVPVGTIGKGYNSQLLQEHAASALVSNLSRSEPLIRFALQKANKTRLVVAASDPAIEPDKPKAMTIEDAIKDAADAYSFEVWTGLVPILPDTKKLLWKKDGQTRRVLMVTWTSYKGYDDKAEKTLSLSRETWVTPAPFVAEACAGKSNDLPALSKRLEQLLGLRPESGKDRFIEFWVEPKDLFRPCPDPEITDHECGIDFPEPSSLVTINKEHVQWFNDLKAKSYGPDGYPWTRLGYTYDWGGAKIGLSEYVIKAKANVIVGAVKSTADYCK